MMLLQFKNIGLLVTVITVVLAASATVQAQQIQSDYQIQKEYKEEVTSIKKDLEQVSTDSIAQNIIKRIDSLETSYAQHSTLINKAIYPNTYEEQISELQTRASTIQNNLATIEQQEQRLTDLTTKLDSYGEKLARLNLRTDSLQTAVQNSVQSEKKLSSQLRDYRESLERRDELILSFIDSVVVTYQDLGLNSMTDLEDVRSENRLDSDRSPLKMIRTIPSESMQLLKSNSPLNTEDYLRMKTVQKEFARMWDKVGSKFAEAYSANSTQAESEIKQSILKWEQALNDRLWTSMYQSFKEANIDVKKFDNSSSLYEAVNTYVEQGFTQSKQDSGEKAYENFTRFSDFWNNRVKGQWTPSIIQTDVLTSAQIATIDQKTNQWAAIAKPESNWMAYLLGVSVLAIAVLGFMLIREKSTNKKQ